MNGGHEEGRQRGRREEGAARKHRGTGAMAVSEGITVERERCHRWQEGRADYRSKEGQPLEEERKHGEAEVLQEDGTNRTAARRRGEDKGKGQGEVRQAAQFPYIYISDLLLALQLTWTFCTC